MKIRQCHNWGIQTLKEGCIKDYRSDVDLFLMDILEIDFSKLITSLDEEMPDSKIDKFKNYIYQRLENVPLQYIINKQNFYGYEFYVDKRVLIPRPETELIVSFLVEKIGPDKTQILDLCCGCGTISVSLDKELKNSDIFASDISEDALSVAKFNAIKNKSDVCFIKSDLFDNIEDSFDYIVSNPPYIKSLEIDFLDGNVKDYEPRLALDGGEDGMYFYRKIIKEAPKYLNVGGFLIFEIGYNQKDDIIDILEKNGSYEGISSIKDFSNLDRVVYAFLK